MHRCGGLERTAQLESSESGPVPEAFWHDDGSGFAFIAHDTATLPFVVVERFVAAARKPSAHRRFLRVAQRRPSSRTCAAYLFAA